MDNNPVIEVRFGDWIGEGWTMFTRQWKGWVTLSLSFFVVTVLPILAIIVVMYVMMFATAMLQQQHSRGAPPQIPIAIFLVFYLALFAVIIVLIPLTVLLMGGAYRAAFKQLRGGRVEFRDLFSARDCYWRLLGATFIHFALVMIGAILCIIPAFIVGGLLFFTIPLIVERNLGIADAIRASRELTQRRLWMFVLFAILVQLIASAGSYVCYVGLLATWPLMFTITAVAFRDCFGVEGAQSFAQAALPQQTGYGPGYGSGPVPDSPPVEQQSMVCPTCQASLPPAAQFCFRCGTNLGAQ
jgi:membrane-anchored glycerophosphoryl diester phosphodiesterase (GDPDase)